MNVLITLLCGVAITACYYYWTFNYWKKRGVHTLKPSILFGNLSDVIFKKVPAYRLFQEAYDTCKKRGDKFMGFYFFNQPALIIADPELVKNILITDFNHFTDRLFYRNEEDPFTVNIVSARGNQWKKMKELLSPAFSPSKMKNMCFTLLQVGDQVNAALGKFAKNYEIVNLNDVVSKYIVDVTGRNIFGIECNTLQNSNVEFQINTERIFGGSFTQSVKMILCILCPSILHLFKIPVISYDIQNYFLNLIKETVEYRENNNIVRNDLMNSIIQLRNNINIEKENNLTSSNISESEKSLKIEEIAAQAVVFFGAAYETSSITILLCIYELAVNEDIQNILRTEIANTLEKHEGQISYDVVMEMTYLDKCVLETLRKYAAGSMIGRVCTEKYKFPNSDMVVDVGSTLYIPIYEIQNDPEYYPNPEKFDPERFSPESKSKRPNCSFLALGEGQRNCIGGRLGLLTTKIFLITFLTNYNFRINSKSQLSPLLNKSKVVLGLEGPIYLNVEEIK